MSSFSKQVIAVIALAFIVVMLYFGTYLPYEKGHSYIEALNVAPQATSLQDIDHIFSVPLSRPSPVGQEELVRNFVSTMGNIIGGNSKGHPEIATQSLKFVASYADPLVNHGVGLSYAQTLLVVGSAYETAYSVTGNTSYSDAARTYFLHGLEVSPNRPQFLYALFSDYQLRGEKQKAHDIGEKIISFWPDDAQMRAILSGTPVR